MKKWFLVFGLFALPLFGDEQNDLKFPILFIHGFSSAFQETWIVNSLPDTIYTGYSDGIFTGAQVGTVYQTKPEDVHFPPYTVPNSYRDEIYIGSDIGGDPRQKQCTVRYIRLDKVAIPNGYHEQSIPYHLADKYSLSTEKYLYRACPKTAKHCFQ